MCGIAGIVTLTPQKINVAEHLLHMSRILRHRGPDDEGFLLLKNETVSHYSGTDTPAAVEQSRLPYTSAQKLTAQQHGAVLGFCHRRLSILDLSPRGHQPMSDAGGRIHLIYNGEIYNYIELRTELEAMGCVFTSGSDTEVLINAYRAWGTECLQRFNGMWSFALLDEDKGELIAARDRFGVKPFYYYHDSENFCFASELKALAALPFVRTGVNDQAVYDFFVNHEMEYSPHGFFKNLTELFPGKLLRLRLHSNRLEEEEYYSLKVNTAFWPLNEREQEEFAGEAGQLLYRAVKLRMRSDVKVGSCLSGGIDSSAIGGIMQQLLQKKDGPEFFTAVFRGKEIDESGWAAEVVKNGGHWNTTEPSAEELWTDLDNLVYSQDLPLWSSSTYAQFRVMRLAQERGIKVLLDGQGGDELFAGYVPYYLSFWNELKRNGDTGRLSEEQSAFAHGGSAGRFRLKETIKERIENSPSVLLKSLKDPQLKFLNPDFLGAHARAPQLKKKYSTLNEHLRAEFANTRLKLYLKCEDRCSMWHAVESRTPFADDIQLIEKLFSLPGSSKIRNGILKYLLREAAKKYLPHKIYARQDKMGYVTPHNAWMRSLYAQVSREDFSAIRQYLHFPRFSKKKEELFSPAGSQERFLAFKILTFNRWKRIFRL